MVSASVNLTGVIGETWLPYILRAEIYDDSIITENNIAIDMAIIDGDGILIKVGRYPALVCKHIAAL